MKKFLLILGSIIGILVLAMILLPFIYKDTIVSKVKTEANKNLEAKVDFDNDLGLSLFKNFPHFTLTMRDIEVVNKAPFEGDTLTSIQRFQATIDVMSVISGDQIQINGIYLNQPRVHVHVLEDGRANWNIMKSSDEAEAEESAKQDQGASNYKMGLKQYSIQNGQLVYNDESVGMKAKLNGFKHEGSGDFTMDQFNLETNTKVNKLSFIYNGIAYMDRVNTELEATLDMDMQAMKFTFKENDLRLNNLLLGFDGFVAMPSDDVKMDVTFNAKKTSFKTLMSLVPNLYTESFDKVETSGKMAFNGWVQGVYNEDSLPGYNVNVKVNNGMFQYPELPMAVNNLNMNLAVNCDDGVVDHTVINMKKLHWELGEEPFDARLLVKTPISDPFIDAKLNGRVDLGAVQKTLPVGKNTQLAGLIKSDLRLKGNKSSLEQEQYDQFTADGSIEASEVTYNSPDMPQRIDVGQANLKFTPQKVQLPKFSMEIGRSNLHANGRLNHVIGYIMQGDKLEGQLSLNSSYLNINSLLASEEEGASTETNETGTDASEEKLQAVEIPANIDFVMDAQMERVIYDNMDMANMVGKVVVRNKAVQLKDLRMQVFDGRLMANGAYDTKDPHEPQSDFDLKITGFDINKTYNTFESVQKYAPAAKYVEGDFDADMVLSTPLDQHMNPIYDSLYSKGKLDIDRAVLEGYPLLEKIASTVKDDQYSRVVMTDIHPSYIIEDGRFRLREPLEFSVGKSNAVVTGSSGLDQTLDYLMKVDMPAGKLQSTASNLVNQIGGGQVDVPQADRIVVDLNITGTHSNPKIKPAFGGTKQGEGSGKSIEQQAKDQIENKKDELKQKAKKEAEKRKKQLKEKKEKAKEKAKDKKKEKEKEVKEKLEEEKEKKKEEAEDKVKDIFK